MINPAKPWEMNLLENVLIQINPFWILLEMKTFPSYFSNQSPRTYAPKPAYEKRYWQNRGLKPESIDFLGIIERCARRYYATSFDISGTVRLPDSRTPESLQTESPTDRFNW